MMKVVLKNSLRVLPAMAILLTFEWFLANAALAAAQTSKDPAAQSSTAHDGQTASWYERFIYGPTAPLIDTTEPPGPFQGLSVSGFVNNTTGMWLDSSALRPYVKHKNSLSTERSWLQLDANYLIDGDNRLFVRGMGCV